MLFEGIKRTKVFRRFFESLGMPINHTTPAYEDKNDTMQQIQADKLTPRIKHMDIMMSWLYEEHALETYVTV